MKRESYLSKKDTVTFNGVVSSTFKYAIYSGECLYLEIVENNRLRDFSMIFNSKLCHCPIVKNCFQNWNIFCFCLNSHRSAFLIVNEEQVYTSNSSNNLSTRRVLLEEQYKKPKGREKAIRVHQGSHRPGITPRKPTASALLVQSNWINQRCNELKCKC